MLQAIQQNIRDWRSDMSNKEFKRLLAFQYAKIHRFRPTVHVTSRRSAKSMSNATGQVLRNSRIVSEVGLDKDFNNGNFRRYV